MRLLRALGVRVGAVVEGGDWNVADSGEPEAHGGKGRKKCRNLFGVVVVVVLLGMRIL